MDDKIVEAVARAAHEVTSLLPWEVLPARQREEKIRHVGGVIEAYNAALQKRGMVIVPREPSSKMIHEAGLSHGCECYGDIGYFPDSEIALLWGTMISAASPLR